MNGGATRDVSVQLADRRLRGRWLGADREGQVDPYAPTLVFLHEGLGSLDFFRTFPAALCARTGLRGFAYDRTGYGQSSAWPSPPGTRYMEIEADRILPEVLDAAGIEACLLIGHADGGTIALNFAAVQPPLLRGIVTIGAHVVSEERTLGSIRHAREAFLTTDLRDRLVPYHGGNVDGAFGVWNAAWLTPGFEPMDRSGRLGRVRVPVLALQGEHDEYATLAQLQAISRGVSGRCETRLVTGCGHAPHLQDEKTVVEVIARFISTLWRGPSEPARATLAVVLACAGLIGADGVALAQPDPCAGESVQAVLSRARLDLARADDAGAAEQLATGAASTSGCHDLDVAMLAMTGWAEARRLARVGGVPDQLQKMREVLERLAFVRGSRPPTSMLSQKAAYADAVLRAAVAAAQDERDEMQVYLTHARTVADSLRLAREGGPWPLPIDLAEGELWLEVDRFVEARDALGRVSEEPLVGRASLGLGQSLERLGESGGACVAYRRAAEASLGSAAAERARLAIARLKCGAR